MAAAIHASGRRLELFSSETLALMRRAQQAKLKSREVARECRELLELVRASRMRAAEAGAEWARYANELALRAAKGRSAAGVVTGAGAEPARERGTNGRRPCAAPHPAAGAPATAAGQLRVAWSRVTPRTPGAAAPPVS